MGFFSSTSTSLFLVTATLLLSADAFHTSATKRTCTSTTTSLGPTARNGLYYEDVTIGQGRRVLPGDTVLCYYVGTFKQQGGGNSGGGNPFLDAITGGGGSKEVVFDQTEDGQPFSFKVGKNQVIKGWDLGVLGDYDLEIPPMNVGGDRKLVIPSTLAYGATGVGPIPPDTDLNFQIEVLQSQNIGGVDMEMRLKGYAAVLGFTVFTLSLGWFVLHHI